MYRFHVTQALALVLLPTMLAFPSSSAAQGAGGLTDARGRSTYSVEELAQALFAEPAAPVRTRGVGPAQALQVAPAPRPTVTLNVLFAPSAEALPDVAYAEIDKLGTVLSWPQYAEYRIQLEGHTDSQGAERQNRLLSEKRVQGIKAYLAKTFQVAPERVRTVGYGSAKPIAPNDTPTGRLQNRRVEVVNLGRAQ